MSSFILAVDFETTGLDPKLNEIIQFGAVLLNSSFDEVSEYSSLVRPRWPERGIRDDFNVFEYTGISRNSLSSERLFLEVVKEFEAWLLSRIFTKSSGAPPSRKALHDVTFFGQNVAFDVSMLKEEYSRIGKSYPFDFHTLNLESFFVFSQMLEKKRVPKVMHLRNIATHCGVTNLKAHDAIQDIRTTVECARQLLLRHKT